MPDTTAAPLTDRERADQVARQLADVTAAPRTGDPRIDAVRDNLATVLGRIAADLPEATA